MRQTMHSTKSFNSKTYTRDKQQKKNHNKCPTNERLIRPLRARRRPTSFHSFILDIVLYVHHRRNTMSAYECIYGFVVVALCACVWAWCAARRTRTQLALQLYTTKTHAHTNKHTHIRVVCPLCLAHCVYRNCSARQPYACTITKHTTARTNMQRNTEWRRKKKHSVYTHIVYTDRDCDRGDGE